MKNFIIGFLLLPLAACAAPSTTLQNGQGQTYSCSSWGVGVVGTIVALSSQSNCVDKMEAAGWHEGAPASAQQFDPASNVSRTVIGKDGQIQFELPAGWAQMEPPPALKARANVQIYARNPAIDAGLLVTADDRRDVEDLAQYGAALRTNQMDLLSGALGSDIQQITVNGNPAVRVDVRGVAQGIKVHFLITAVETSSRIIKLNVFTAESKFTEVRPTFEAMATGLAERSTTAVSK